MWLGCGKVNQSVTVVFTTTSQLSHVKWKNIEDLKRFDFYDKANNGMKTNNNSEDNHSLPQDKVYKPARSTDVHTQLFNLHLVST